MTTHPPGDTFLVNEKGRLKFLFAIYVCEVVNKKVSGGETFLVTNGGIHHHLPASGNFGQVILKNYPVCIGNRMKSEKSETVNVVRTLCTPWIFLPKRWNSLPRTSAIWSLSFSPGPMAIPPAPMPFSAI